MEFARKETPLVSESDVYKEMVERGIDPDYDTIDIEDASNSKEQVRLYKEVREEEIRDGGP